MERVVAEKRIHRGFKSKLPTATKYLIKPGDHLRRTWSPGLMARGAYTEKHQEDGKDSLQLQKQHPKSCRLQT